MTEKAKKLYDEISDLFQEGDGSLETDMLDNLYDILRLVDDDFLEQFTYKVNNELYEDEDEDSDDEIPMYDDPTITFSLLKNKSIYFRIECGCVACVNPEHPVFSEEGSKYPLCFIPNDVVVFSQEELNLDRKQKLKMKAGLILHDSEDKETRKQIVKDFKKNMTIDMLIVFNMLLTGFDAPRLKRLYFGRKLKDHNLLQAITRVNRPYPGMKNGYLIDFADIKQNFEATNEAYMLELNRFNDVDVQGKQITDTFTSVIEDKDAIIAQMKEIKQVLFDYSYDNAEDFSSEISTLEDKAQLIELKNALNSAKDMANLVRTFGDEDMKEKFAMVEITKLPLLLQEVQRRIDMINQKEAFETSDETKMHINEAMLNVEFKFSSIGSEEMKMIGSGDDLKNKFQSAIHAFIDNMDPDDPEYITIQEAFRQRFKEHGFTVDSMAKFNEQTAALDEILQKLKALDTKNRQLLKKYNGDAKFARVHKRIREENEKRKQEKKKVLFSQYDDIMQMLITIKTDVDSKVYDRNDILKKDAYFEQTVLMLINGCVVTHFPNLQPEYDDYKFIERRITQQYLSQYNDTYAYA